MNCEGLWCHSPGCINLGGGKKRKKKKVGEGERIKIYSLSPHHNPS